MQNVNNIDTDVCIVGAGPAGISLALSLDEAGVRTVLLESGGIEPDSTIQSLNEMNSIGRPYSGSATRRRQFGGNSNCWSGWCRPLDPIEFKPRDYINGSGWPIDYQEYARYLSRAHVLCELGPLDYNFSNWQKKIFGQADNYPQVKSSVLESGVFQHSPPTLFGRKYRDKLEASRSCTVVLHATATATNLSGRVLESMKARSINGKTLAIKANYFVLACGGIENARLLLTLNGVGRPGLGNEYDQVGRYFTDHLILHDYMSIYPLSRHLRPYVDKVSTRGRVPHAITPWLRMKDEMQKKHKVINSTVRLNRPVPAEVNSVTKNTIWPKLFGFESGDNIVIPEMENMAPVMIFDVLPNPDSRITIGRAKDAFGVQRGVINWQIMDRDLEYIWKLARIYSGEYMRLGYARTSPLLLSEDRVLRESDYYIGYHHYGTTRMSHDPQYGVVDINCRVHSLDNLYIAGSSVFPTPGASTPTLSIVALVLRLGDHLKTRMAE